MQAFMLKATKWRQRYENSYAKRNRANEGILRSVL